MDRQHVTAILDWEATKGAPAAHDAWWATITSSPALADRLEESFGHYTDLGPSFRQIHELCRIRILLTLVAHTKTVGNQAGFDTATAELHRLT